MLRARLAIAISMICAALAACSTFPELDASVSDEVRDAPYPDLVPMASLEQRTTEGRITDATLPDVNARIARLKARAARLRGTVIDAPTRRRMSGGVQ